MFHLVFNEKIEMQYKKFTISCFLVSIMISAKVSAEMRKLKGVSLSRMSLYDPDKNFTCMDGSLTIPFDQINDDYCDCPDATDEPGTSACPNGVFYCVNSGHKSLNIASSRVNDGVCDCCDGSDEYAKSTDRKCVNNCLELGRMAREEALRLAELIKEGKQLREELSHKGIQLKREKKEKIIEYQKYKEEAEKVKVEKEYIKKQAEELENVALERYRKIEEEQNKQKEEEEHAKTREEAIKTFNFLDSNEDGKIDVNELQSKHTFDKDGNGEVSEDEAKYFLNGEHSVELEKFISDVWSNVKPYMMLDEGLFEPPSVDDENDIKDDETNIDDSKNEDDETDQDIEKEEEAVDVEKTSTYDDETLKLIQDAVKARNEFNDADRALQNIITEIKNIEEYLEKDFGTEEEFATLDGQCFDYTDHEYIYTFCPFDKTIQKPKSNSLETRLGVWSQWIGTDYKYDLMLYDKGQSCWNGPQRSTQVHITCGSVNKITSVSEPNRCEYLFEFTTPAACSGLKINNSNDIHDEL